MILNLNLCIDRPIPYQEFKKKLILVQRGFSRGCVVWVRVG